MRTGGKDDVSKTHLLWKNPRITSYITSPVLVGDHLFGVNEQGMAYCLSSKTGEAVYQHLGNRALEQVFPGFDESSNGFLRYLG